MAITTTAAAIAPIVHRNVDPLTASLPVLLSFSATDRYSTSV
jgi:hypothetical protein